MPKLEPANMLTTTLKQSEPAASSPIPSGLVRDQVLDRIRRAVSSGEYALGDSLPSERVLADRYGVARNTVRASLQRLEAEGVISREGYRRRVRSLPSQSDSALNQAIGIVTVARTLNPYHVAPGWETFIEIGAMNRAQHDGFNAMVYTPQLLEDAEMFARLADHPPHGLILCSAVYRFADAFKALERLRKTGLAVVAEGNPPGAEHVDRVVSDHTEGAATLTRFLIERGCRRIVYMLPGAEHARYWVDKRMAGYQQAMEEAGLTPLPPSIQLMGMHINTEQDFDAMTILKLGHLTDFIQTHGDIDAVMCASDGLVAPVAAALRKMGRRPQEDVLIVGYDNFAQDVTGTQWEPTQPLATVDKNNMQIGRQLVDLLLARINGELDSQPVEHVVKPSLVVLADSASK